MLADLIGKAPLWLVKFVVRGIIRRAQMRYNKVKPPKSWEKVSIPKSLTEVKDGISFQDESYEFNIVSIDHGIINIQLKRKQDQFVETGAIVQNNNIIAPKFQIISDKDFITIKQEETAPLVLTFNVVSNSLEIKDSHGHLLMENLNFYYSSKANWYKMEFITEGTEEHHYGFGEKGGPLDKKDTELEFWNTDSFAYSKRDTRLYQSQPIHIVVRENGYVYCLIYDNPHKSKIKITTLAERNLTTYYVAGGGINLYVISADTIKSLFRKIMSLLGYPPLPPLSVLGNHQSRWSYYPEKVVRELAEEFRKRKIPLDWIHLDIDYMDDYKIFTWNKERFPEPKRLSEDLRKKGIKLVVITDPGVKIEKGYELYEEGLKDGHFCLSKDGKLYVGKVWPGPCHFPDFTQEKTRSWFGSKFSLFLENGIMGFWLDMNEPSIFSRKGTAELTMIHPHNGQPLFHSQVHNLYGFLMSKAVFESLTKLEPNRRHFVLTRAAYLGIQRYAGSWTGDNIAEWEHLKLSIPMLLNMTVSGQLIVGPDIGGFVGKPSSELLIRWYQAALGYPFYRNHTINKHCSQEPWQYDADTEEMIRKTIQLRYQLLLYIYLAIKEQCETGLPAFRPLWVEFPTDPYAHLKDWSETEYLIGSKILVAPILDKGKRKRKVYLPKGMWYSFDGKNKFVGGKIYDIQAPLDHLPIFVKAGSIIPIINNEIQHVEEVYHSLIDLYAYTDANNNAEGQVYLDDGITLNYKRGDYEELKVKLEMKEKKWRLKITKSGKGSYIKLGDILVNGQKEQIQR